MDGMSVSEHDGVGHGDGPVSQYVGQVFSCHQSTETYTHGHRIGRHHAKTLRKKMERVVVWCLAGQTIRDSLVLRSKAFFAVRVGGV